MAKEKTLECGQIVWGLAFSAWPAAEAGETDPTCAVGLPCLILATGLNNGQIKVWEVQTGEREQSWLQAVVSPHCSPSEGDAVSVIPRILPQGEREPLPGPSA